MINDESFEGDLGTSSVPYCHACDASLLVLNSTKRVPATCSVTSWSFGGWHKLIDACVGPCSRRDSRSKEFSKGEDETLL